MKGQPFAQISVIRSGRDVEVTKRRGALVLRESGVPMDPEERPWRWSANQARSLFAARSERNRNVSTEKYRRLVIIVDRLGV
jgi:hypothetical protein